MSHLYLVAVDEKLIATASGIFTLDEKSITALDPIAEYDLAALNGTEYRLLLLEQDSDLLPKAENRIGLRSVMGTLISEEEYAMLARAAQIATWYHSFKFCPRCATSLRASETELSKICDGCGHHQYPRISPCIIVLVRKGGKCLLAHASRFADGRYSTLAGFIEAGESAESAVAREVMEEVGIEIQNVEYCFSQSWPFPHSLMLGFMADYKAGDLTPDGEEIILADWFDADNLPILPPTFTIARRLIDRFMNQIGKPLADHSGPFFAAE